MLSIVDANFCATAAAAADLISWLIIAGAEQANAQKIKEGEICY